MLIGATLLWIVHRDSARSWDVEYAEYIEYNEEVVTALIHLASTAAGETLALEITYIHDCIRALQRGLRKENVLEE